MLPSSGLKISHARKPQEASADCFTLVSCFAYSSTLKMKVMLQRNYTAFKSQTIELESVPTDEDFGSSRFDILTMLTLSDPNTEAVKEPLRIRLHLTMI
jgi:hypothetical protein